MLRPKAGVRFIRTPQIYLRVEHHIEHLHPDIARAVFIDHRFGSGLARFGRLRFLEFQVYRAEVVQVRLQRGCHRKGGGSFIRRNSQKAAGADGGALRLRSGYRPLNGIGIVLLIGDGLIVDESSQLQGFALDNGALGRLNGQHGLDGAWGSGSV